MSLHSMHRVASSAKHKTSASLKSVFASKGLSGAPASSRASPNFSETSDSDKCDVAQTRKDDVQSSSIDHNGSPPDVENLGRDEAEEDRFSDDDGYVTASEFIGFEGSIDTGTENSNFCDGERFHSETGKDNEVIDNSSGGHARIQSGRSSKEDDHSNLHSQIIKELRITAIGSTSEKCLSKVDDATLLRFLVARNMDVAKAADMFIRDLRWRDELMPLGYISENLVTRQLDADKVFLQGIDKRGRPVLVVVGSKHFSKGRDLEEFKRFIVYCIEKTIGSIPTGQDKFVTIVDLGATGYKNMDTSATLMIVDFLQAHYPERMGQLYLVHVPSMFNVSYKLIEGAIDVKTREKIVIVEDVDLGRILNQELGEECLPEEYGGQLTFVPIQYAVIDSSTFPCSAVQSR